MEYHFFKPISTLWIKVFVDIKFILDFINTLFCVIPYWISPVLDLVNEIRFGYSYLPNLTFESSSSGDPLITLWSRTFWTSSGHVVTTLIRQCADLITHTACGFAVFGIANTTALDTQPQIADYSLSSLSSRLSWTLKTTSGLIIFSRSPTPLPGYHNHLPEYTLE